MKDKIALTIFIILIIAVAGGTGIILLRGKKSPAPILPADYKNATYEIGDRNFTLVDGRSEVQITGASASQIVTQYFGNEVSGDLNGDGVTDEAFLLFQQSGGTGTFFYAVAALKMPNGYQGTNGILLGDRIAPQTTEINNGEIIVNYADRNSGEPMTAKPSLGVSKYLHVENGKLIEDSAPNARPNAQQSQKKMETADFSINLPGGWEESTSTRGVLAIAINPGEKINDPAVQKIGFKSYFAVNKDVLDGKTMAEYSDSLKYYLSQNIPGTQFTKEQDTTINGNSGHIIEMELTQESINFKILSVLVAKGNDIWAVSFNTPKSAWDEYKDLFYSTANSFKLK